MKRFCMLVGLLVLVTLPALAGEGRIPIWQPITITQSGSYVVTRDIGANPTSNPPRAITIQADDVDINLNGFALRLGEPVIFADGVKRITVRNGEIESSEDAIDFRNVEQFELKDLVIRGSEDFCTVNIFNGDDGIVEHNRIRGPIFGPTVCARGTAIVLRYNVINLGPLDFRSCIGCEASENKLQGLSLDLTSSGNLIRDNLVSSASGIGIDVLGDENHIEGNLIRGSGGFGLQLGGNGNVFRRNTARGNAGVGCVNPLGNVNFCDTGVGNTSHGDNYIPNQM